MDIAGGPPAAARRGHRGTRGEVDVLILTSGVQLAHLFQIAEAMRLEPDLLQGLRRTVVASIGPTTSEEIARRGLSADLEASHPKMGVLVREAAERSADLLRTKRTGNEARSAS